EAVARDLAVAEAAPPAGAGSDGAELSRSIPGFGVKAEQVHALAIAGRLDQGGVPRRVVGDEHEARPVEGVDLKPDLLVDRRVEGAADDVVAPASRCRLDGLEKGRGNGLVVDAFEEAEVGSRLVVGLIVDVIADGR